jgi:hypothetical protein
MATLVVLQPGYLPWLGFFDQVRRSDVFVLYDDVAFDKHGWRNRNRIKTATGPTWLTVPVRHKGRSGQAIHDVEIDNQTDWAAKHLASIEQAYARAPFRDRYLPEVAALLRRPWSKLVELDIALTLAMCDWLGLAGNFHRASMLGIAGERSARLVALCGHFGADVYLSGNAAQDYLDVAQFTRAGIRVEWQDFHHPVYAQLHGPFLPFMSALDLILNAGPDGAAILAAAGRTTTRRH